MPEFRQDPLTERWVIIAEDRADRPTEFFSEPACHAMDPCPFCAGHEQDTPDAILSYPREEERRGSWQVRVIPNKYPAAILDGPVGCRLALPRKSRPVGFFLGEPTDRQPVPFNLVSQPGIGVHEVIVESPRHVASFTELSDEQARFALCAYRDRLSALAEDPRLKYGLLFKNCRGGAGATLEHVHSQMLATSFIPSEIDLQLQRALHHFDHSGECLYCQILRNEIADGVRLVVETPSFVAYCPFASRFPYETWILPRRHSDRFERISAAELSELAQFLQLVLRRFESLFPQVSYNYWIHTAPFHASCDDCYHWHFEMIPRVTSQGGYEWGAGSFVNPVAPETAARRLREKLPSDRSV